MKLKPIAVIGSGSYAQITSDLANQLNEIIEQLQYELTKYQIIGTYKSGKELRRERRKEERKNK